jgi:hypothetical protein
MTDPEAREIIENTIDSFPESDCDSYSLSLAVVGALATSGFAIVRVDPEVVRRVLAELATKAERQA